MGWPSGHNRAVSLGSGPGETGSGGRRTVDSWLRAWQVRPAQTLGVLDDCLNDGLSGNCEREWGHHGLAVFVLCSGRRGSRGLDRRHWRDPHNFVGYTLLRDRDRVAEWGRDLSIVGLAIDCW